MSADIQGMRNGSNRRTTTHTSATPKKRPVAKSNAPGKSHAPDVKLQAMENSADTRLEIANYLEQLLKDSQELHDRRRYLKQDNHSKRDEQGVESQVCGNASNLPTESPVQDILLNDRPWFQSNDAPIIPLYISEATCTAFATRLCQCLKASDTPTPHLPRSRYIDDSVIVSLLDGDVQWPSHVSAQLMVKTALGHVIPSFHLALKKDTVDMLYTVYQRGDFGNPSIKCKYFALFAIAQVYSTPYSLSDTSDIPGLAYFAKALSLIQVIPERPSMIHIESLLLIAYYCQFVNRFHSAYLLIGSALRLGLSIGLNYNIPQSQGLHPIAREHRIRIWWTIYVLDRFWGSKSGFPVQIHDADIHVDPPSTSISETYHEQFSDGAYQVAAIELARIIGNTTGEIYCRRISAETFLHREQRLLSQLKQWAESIPRHLRLREDIPNTKHLVQMHLQFNFCVILAIRPVLLHALTLKTRDQYNQSANFTSPVLITLSEACIHAARHTLALCMNEWTGGSLAVFGYAFPAFLFSATLILVISSLLPLGDPNDRASAETAMEILKNLSLSDSLASRDLYERLQMVLEYLRCSPLYRASLAHSAAGNTADLSSTAETSEIQSGRELSNLRSGVRPSDDSGEINVPYLTAEMALHQPTMLDFLTQSSMDFGLLEPTVFLNDFDLAFSMSSNTPFT
ncbi:hypothetical protein N7535_003585 [Penicillium sp. DV-2018c]|nr:hypothetical protein N7461_000714 [Penicillium sp. DV-2018c]KAJ5576659.1 hypothetical protein N7535_003585 [Penicillium sp. DV-2018c]